MCIFYWYVSATEDRLSITNQLRKTHIDKESMILAVIGEFSSHKPTHVWLSYTLPQDLNLPMTTPVPSMEKVLQAFVLCVDYPPFVLILRSKRDVLQTLDTYNRDTARWLLWSLLDFCHIDFAVLACSLEVSSEGMFTKEALLDEVKTQRREMKKYFKSPLNLNEETVGQLKRATTALV